MTARDELIEIVTRDPESSGGDEVWATDLVDGYAHELAQKIRDRAEKIDTSTMRGQLHKEAALQSADLIDPWS